MHISTKWLIGELVIIFLSPVILAMLNYPMFLPYEGHKALHILGAVLLLGNIIVTGVWMFMAERTGNDMVIRFGAKVVHWADVWFTAPGSWLLLVNGLLMVTKWGILSGWVMTALALFTLSGIIWVLLLIPMQDYFVKVAWNGNPIKPEFYTRLKQWYIWGSIATILPVMSMFIMVIKPTI